MSSPSPCKKCPGPFLLYLVSPFWDVSARSSLLRWLDLLRHDGIPASTLSIAVVGHRLTFAPSLASDSQTGTPEHGKRPRPIFLTWPHKDAWESFCKGINSSGFSHLRVLGVKLSADKEFLQKRWRRGQTIGPLSLFRGGQGLQCPSWALAEILQDPIPGLLYSFCESSNVRSWHMT